METLSTKIKRRLVKDYRSKKLATGAKRLDLIAAQMMDVLYLMQEAGRYPLRGKRCLEIGSGWVLSHSLIFWLLGAEEVVATDIEPVAKPYVLTKAIAASVHSLIRDGLAPFEDHDLLRKRLDELKKIQNFNFDVLANLGIKYLAPVDLAKDVPPGKFDFIFSNSVLEHVPVDDVSPLLTNLNSILNTGGRMVHRIHLEDHRNIENAPFNFFSEPLETYTRASQSARGNRILRSQWIEIFNTLQGSTSTVLFDFFRLDKNLPDKIDKSIPYVDEMDLRCSNLGMLTIKI